ncbi:MAG TPA: DUF1573 domain-containing protein [Bacillota bacterium]|nr:DUF1573 domain-containing protein [Bacillota bacterium]
MKKPLLIGAIGLIIVALIILFFVFGKSFLWVPKLEISEESWDFGTVKTGSDLKHTIVIKNTGSAEMNVFPYPNCPACLNLEMAKYDIPPKSEEKLHIKIIKTEAGPFEGYIMLESNDPRRQVTKLPVKGTFIK